MSEKYTKYCRKNYCGRVAAVEAKSLLGDWVPFCRDHIPKKAAYIRKIQVRKDD